MSAEPPEPPLPTGRPPTAALLDSLLDAAALADEDGRILGVTAPLSDLLGLGEAELVGRSLDEIVQRDGAHASVTTPEGPRSVEVITLGLLDGETRTRLVVLRERAGAPATLLAHAREVAHRINNALAGIRYRATAVEPSSPLWSELQEIDAAAARAAESLRELVGAIRAGTAPATAKPAATSRPVVLLVEEDAQLRALARRGLASRGLDVREAGSVAEAEAIAAGGGPLDALVSALPAAIDAVRAHRPALPAIQTGGSARSGVESLPKPYTVSALASRIGALLGARTA